MTGAFRLSSITLLLFVGSCSRPISPNVIDTKAELSPDDILRITFIERAPSSFACIGRADVTRKNGIIYVRVLLQRIQPDSDKVIDLPEISIRMANTDREVRLTDGKVEKTIWSRDK